MEDSINSVEEQLFSLDFSGIEPDSLVSEDGNEIAGDLTLLNRRLESRGRRSTPSSTPAKVARQDPVAGTSTSNANGPCKCGSSSKCMTRVCPCKRDLRRCTDACRCRPEKCKMRAMTQVVIVQGDMAAAVPRQAQVTVPIQVVPHHREQHATPPPPPPNVTQSQGEEVDGAVNVPVPAGQQQVEIPEDVMSQMTHNEVWEFVRTVLQDQPELLEVLVQYHARKRRQPGPPPPMPTRNCKCGKCHVMPLAVEQVCCGLKWPDCKTLCQDIRRITLNEEVVLVGFRNVRDVMAGDQERSNRGMRHSAYRQFVLFSWGRLGKGNRVILPSCCVWMIRDRFPSPTGHYTGFKPGKRLL